MPARNRPNNPAPQSQHGVTAELGPTMSPMLLGDDSASHDKEAQKKMLEVIQIFAEPPLPVSDAAPYKVLTRTLLSGTRVELSWGAVNPQETQTEVEIKGVKGVARLCIALSHQNQDERFTVTYGSTVPGEDRVGDAEFNLSLTDAFLVAAKGLLVRKDPPDTATETFVKRHKK
ncbi:MAG: hypothetical protein WAS36_04200 [Candidatus Saccharimonadales bacterium]